MAWPTTSDPRTEFVTIRLTTNEAADLDQMAAANENTRSEEVRAAVAQALSVHRRRIRKANALIQQNDAGA